MGGLLGVNYQSAKVIDSYSFGRVSGRALPNSIGGLVGSNIDSSTIIDSYYDQNTSGQHDTGKGTPEMTAHMMQRSTFNGWDFTNTWQIISGHTYPTLRWQSIPFNIRFLTIPSPQKDDTPFPVTILANTNTFHGNVYLYSNRGEVSPDKVTLTRGEWTGNVTVYTPGKNTQLELRWSNFTGENTTTNSSNRFDVVDAVGNAPANGSITGQLQFDSGAGVFPAHNGTLGLYNRDPDTNPDVAPLYTAQGQQWWSVLFCQHTARQLLSASAN